MARQSVKGPQAHLRGADPVLGAVIDEVERSGGILPSMPPDPLLSDDPLMPTDCYGVLIRGIAGQNISGPSSRAIYRKLVERFGGAPPTPRQILDEDPDALRTAAGLSHAKTVSLRSLAEHILSGALALDRLHDLPDEEVVAQLTAVKGIGAWTADMFLIWHLHRPDVLPVGDLEIRQTVERLYDLPRLPRPADLERVAEPWRPHRTLACLYLWRRTEAATAT
ncbi:DNA-3-methyladenine glycosylase II [Actinacidiphila yanglinensis]|uniref:DNA-3-methyladenine glycosylase II n=1 Tax=Actinacidiphila yanglinensis TaxID=310779 RepID=A0A1H6B8E8_9ACTN|nr:DNA-3-methyladenine glycosylase [Actinacidiphila yanglinensis]SEG56834.1 DNA-3-methyladenine glycosylase II [Actinacidiphila yanglinensis]